MPKVYCWQFKICLAVPKKKLEIVNEALLYV